MSFAVDYKELARQVAEELKLSEVKDALTALKTIDWNPFNEDGDEHVGAWQEIQHNWGLIWDVAVQSCEVAERMVVGVAKLEDPQKHKVVVQVLDDLVRAPWYVEPFDGLIFDALVTAAVKFNKAINWGIPMPEIPPATTEFKEIGG